MKQGFTREEAERMVETYSDLILRLSCTWLRSTQDAEDVCQTVFLKVLESGRAFDSPAHEKAFLIRTAINVCKDELKAARRRNVNLDACAEQAAPEQTGGEVRDAVAALDEKYRAVVYLHYYEGYTAREIASMLRVPTPTITTRLRRARALLGDMLEGEHYETGTVSQRT